MTWSSYILYVKSYIINIINEKYISFWNLVYVLNFEQNEVE